MSPSSASSAQGCCDIPRVALPPALLALLAVLSTQSCSCCSNVSPPAFPSTELIPWPQQQRAHRPKSAQIRTDVHESIREGSVCASCWMQGSQLCSCCPPAPLGAGLVYQSPLLSSLCPQPQSHKPLGPRFINCHQITTAGTAAAPPAGLIPAGQDPKHSPGGTEGRGHLGQQGGAQKEREVLIKRRVLTEKGGLSRREILNYSKK